MKRMSDHMRPLQAVTDWWIRRGGRPARPTWPASVTNRRRLNVESLEARRLLTADGFGFPGFEPFEETPVGDGSFALSQAGSDMSPTNSFFEGDTEAGSDPSECVHAWSPGPSAPECSRDPLYNIYTQGQINSAKEDLDYPVVFDEKMPLYLELLRRGELSERQATNLQDYLEQHEHIQNILAKIARDDALREERAGDMGLQALNAAGNIGAAVSLGVEATGVAINALADEMIRTGIEAANHDSLDMQIAGQLVTVMGMGGKVTLVTVGEATTTTSNPVIGTGTLIVGGTAGMVHIANGDYESADIALGIAEAGIYRANPFMREPVVEEAIQQIENVDLQNAAMGILRGSEVAIPGLEVIILPGVLRCVEGNCFVAGTEVMVAKSLEHPLDHPRRGDMQRVSHSVSEDPATESRAWAPPWAPHALLATAGAALAAAQLHERRGGGRGADDWQRQVDAWILENFGPQAAV